MSFGSFQRGFFLSGIFFVAGVSAATFFYLKLLESENPTGPLDNIPIGHHEFVLRSFHKCFGNITFDVKEDDEFEINGEGTFQAALGEMRKDFSFNIDSGFNSLRQLVGFYITARSGDDRVTFSLIEAHPIKVRLDARVQGKQIKFEREVPGPIVIRKNGDKSVSISHPWLRKIRFSNRSFGEQPLAKKFEIDISDSKVICEQAGYEPLRLDSLTTDLGVLSKDVQSIAKEIGL